MKRFIRFALPLLALLYGGLVLAKSTQIDLDKLPAVRWEVLIGGALAWRHCVGNSLSWELPHSPSHVVPRHSLKINW